MRTIILTFPLLSLFPACAAEDLDAPGAVPACNGSVCDFGIDDPDDDPWPDPTPPDIPDDGHDTMGGDSGGGDPDDPGVWTYTALGQQLFDDGVITGDVTDQTGEPIGTYEVTMEFTDTAVVYEGRFNTPEVFLLIENQMEADHVSFGRLGIDNADGSSKYAEVDYTLSEVVAVDQEWSKLSVQETEVVAFANDLLASFVTPKPQWAPLPADLVGAGPSSCGGVCVGAIGLAVGVCGLVDLCRCLIPGQYCPEPVDPNKKVGCCEWKEGVGGHSICIHFIRADGSCW